MKPEPAKERQEPGTLVCFALDREAAPFRKMAGDLPGVSILVTGPGAKNAEASLRRFLAAHPPRLVFSCGFAGGLNSDLKAGDVLFEPGHPPSATRLSEGRLRAAGARPARFFCADRVATTVADKKKLRDQTGADAVEMESAAIHAVCAERGIPCATVRVISDAADEALPLDFNRLAKPDLGIDWGKLAWAVAQRPGTIPALMELRRKTRFAAAQLAAVLAKIISP